MTHLTDLEVCERFGGFPEAEEIDDRTDEDKRLDEAFVVGLEGAAQFAVDDEDA